MSGGGCHPCQGGGDAHVTPYKEEQPLEQPIKLSAPSGADGAKPSKRKTPNPLHHQVRLVIAACYVHANECEVPWGGRQAKVLSTALDESPGWDLADWARAVVYRFASGVRLLDDPAAWIFKLHSYADGPLDKFRNPSTDPEATARANELAEMLAAKGLVEWPA